jgi:hypothetical protein
VLRPSLPAAALLAAIALAGCRDATAVRDPIVGTFVLRAVGGRALPVVTSQGANFRGGTDTITLLASHYDFAADGTVRLTTSMRYTSDVPARDTVATYTATDLGYSRSGRVLTIAPRTPCPPNALCSGPWEAVYLGGARLLMSFPYPTPTLWEYEAVR